MAVLRLFHVIFVFLYYMNIVFFLFLYVLYDITELPFVNQILDLLYFILRIHCNGIT
ncbi:hypothetical protein DORLON_00256 [Dorea longicatena DSM 13814]|uniref:Uncharacterized protein n=1 Tax=Dorea longicatena DSM 13814 TaxID=411462 RepID=A6BD93_9FIRM|nr:hypothetical protein DORLON_00256 [Dorea longicatena DSM 13814]